MERTFHIFTDGSVIGNPGSGGWAAVLTSGDKIWEMSGSSPWTTISEMELLAAVEALRSIPAGSSVQLYSDSELLISGMLFQSRHWQAHEWRNSRGVPLQHQYLWRELLAVNERLNIQWQWIRGHNRHPFQTRADALAYRAARTQCSGLRMAA
ncbi:MAG TPA: ribonuclease H [Terracidiphilus sp.]|nr:ribonuclease H [Terracidiphilus sp.]